MPNEISVTGYGPDPVEFARDRSPNRDRDTWETTAHLSRSETKAELAEMKVRRHRGDNVEREVQSLEARLQQLDDHQKKLDRQAARQAHWIADRHRLSIDGELIDFEEGGEAAEFATSRVGRLLVACALEGKQLPDEWQAFLLEVIKEPRKVVT